MSDNKTIKMSKFNDEVWGLVWLYGQGHDISVNGISELIRRRWDNYFETSTSPIIRETLGIDTIKSYSQARSKYPTSKTGVYIEHINTVKSRATELMKMGKENPNITKNDVEVFIRESYKSVYKHKTLEPLEGSEAWVYLPKK